MSVRLFAAVLVSAAILSSAGHVNAMQANAGQTDAAPAKTSQANSAETANAQADDPAKKLGAFVGKWETEGAFTSGQKTSTSLECRWSPQGAYLVCDQLVRMAGEHRQFTVYSYDSKTGNVLLHHAGRSRGQADDRHGCDQGESLDLRIQL